MTISKWSRLAVVFVAGLLLSPFHRNVCESDPALVHRYVAALAEWTRSRCVLGEQRFCDMDLEEADRAAAVLASSYALRRSLILSAPGVRRRARPMRSDLAQKILDNAAARANKILEVAEQRAARAERTGAETPRGFAIQRDLRDAAGPMRLYISPSVASRFDLRPRDYKRDLRKQEQL
jgi:hypothetical protein